MKYILTAALAIGFFATASAQQNHQVKVIRTANPVIPESGNTQVILDKLQHESENTVVYPLVRMTQKAVAKAQSIKHAKQERIRTNNGKRVVKSSRA